MSLEHLVTTFRQQAQACARLGSELYATLLERCADDLAAGGPTAAVLAGHEDDPGPAATALRLMGGVHRLVLSGDAPGLAAYFPSVGGTASGHGSWEALREVLTGQSEQVRASLDSPPQTNEVGRAAALLGGLLHLARERDLPVALHEIGTSGGLLLRADHFRYTTRDGSTSWGPADSPIRLSDAWRGRPPPVDAELRIDTRAGTDVAPVDPLDEEGRLRLLSYVWADQVERFRRLEAAIEVARRVPADVLREDAVTTVERLRPTTGRWTVLWHSVMWQYLTEADQSAILAAMKALGAAATPAAPVAHLCLEPIRRMPDAQHEFLVVLRTWPGGKRRILGSAAPHGVPTVWE